MESRRGLHGLLEPCRRTGLGKQGTTGHHGRLLGLNLCDDPVALANHWANVTDLSIDANAADPVKFNNATLRFVTATDGRGPGLGGLDIRVNDRQSILQEAKKRNLCE